MTAPTKRLLYLQRIRRGSKAPNEKYLAPTIIIIPYIEVQSPHCVGTWILGTDINSSRNEANSHKKLNPCPTPTPRTYMDQLFRILEPLAAWVLAGLRSAPNSNGAKSSPDLCPPSPFSVPASRHGRQIS